MSGGLKTADLKFWPIKGLNDRKKVGRLFLRKIRNRVPASRNVGDPLAKAIDPAIKRPTLVDNNSNRMNVKLLSVQNPRLCLF